VRESPERPIEEAIVMSETKDTGTAPDSRGMSNLQDEFLLGEWVDSTKPISKAARRRCEAAMAEHVFASGEVHLPDFDWSEKLKRLHKTIRRHNLPFALEQARKAIGHGKRVQQEIETRRERGGSI
jgi:hypothetical protein